MPTCQKNIVWNFPKAISKLVPFHSVSFTVMELVVFVFKCRIIVENVHVSESSGHNICIIFVYLDFWLYPAPTICPPSCHCPHCSQQVLFYTICDQLTLKHVAKKKNPLTLWQTNSKRLDLFLFTWLRCFSWNFRWPNYTPEPWLPLISSTRMGKATKFKQNNTTTTPPSPQKKNFLL